MRLGLDSSSRKVSMTHCLPKKIIIPRDPAGGPVLFPVPSTYLLYLLEYLKTKFLATLKFCGSNFRRIRKTNPLGGSVSLLPSQPLIRIIRSCEEIVGKFDSSHRFDYYSQERAVRPK